MNYTSKTRETNRYMREMNLIIKQNPIECELYSIIAELLRNRKNMASFSLRDVSARRTSDLGKKFKTLAGFPDFAVMTMDDIPEMKGAVEIRRPCCKLDNREEQVRLHQHVENTDGSQRQIVVLYTNGLDWRLYTSEAQSQNVSLGQITREGIDWHTDQWETLLSFLEDIDWSGEKYAFPTPNSQLPS